MNYEAYDSMMRDKFKEMHDNEQRWEEFMVDDADLVLVAYGISSRVCKSAVRRARTQGVKLGLIRLISAWPYPEKAFKNLTRQREGTCFCGDEPVRADGPGSLSGFQVLPACICLSDIQVCS